jgi:hypothetical protein
MADSAAETNGEEEGELDQKEEAERLRRTEVEHTPID